MTEQQEKLKILEQAKMTLSKVFGSESPVMLQDIVAMRGQKDLPVLAVEVIPDATMWLDKPQSGQRYVLKLLNQAEAGRELPFLMQTNALFAPDAAQRPVRLLGSGLVQNPTPGLHSWVVQELVAPEFYTVRQYLQKLGRLDVIKAVQLTAAVVHVLAILHKHKLVHADLEGPEAKGHLFWRPDTQELRMIDFNWSKMDEGGYSIDQTAAGQVLAQAVTGAEFRPQQFSGDLAAVAPEAVREQVQYIVEHAIGLNASREKRSYPRTPKGTRQMYQDIEVLLATLARLSDH